MASAKPSREVVGELAVEVLALGECEGMDEDVDLAVRGTPFVHDGSDLRRPTGRRTARRRSTRSMSPAGGPAVRGATRPTRSRAWRLRREGPLRCPRRSSGRSRRRRSAPSCHRAGPSVLPRARSRAAANSANHCRIGARITCTHAWIRARRPALRAYHRVRAPNPESRFATLARRQNLRVTCAPRSRACAPSSSTRTAS